MLEIDIKKFLSIHFGCSEGWSLRIWVSKCHWLRLCWDAFCWTGDQFLKKYLKQFWFNRGRNSLFGTCQRVFDWSAANNEETTFWFNMKGWFFGGTSPRVHFTGHLEILKKICLMKIADSTWRKKYNFFYMKGCIFATSLRGHFAGQPRILKTQWLKDFWVIRWREGFFLPQDKSAFHWSGQPYVLTKFVQSLAKGFLTQQRERVTFYHKSKGSWHQSGCRSSQHNFDPSKKELNFFFLWAVNLFCQYEHLNTSVRKKYSNNAGLQFSSAKWNILWNMKCISPNNLNFHQTTRKAGNFARTCQFEHIIGWLNTFRSSTHLLGC